MEEKESSKDDKLMVALMVVIVILIIVFTLGLYFAVKGEAEKSIEDDKEEKRKRLHDIEIKISSLASTRDKLEQREKMIFLGIRILVAIWIITLNFILWYTLNTNKQMSEQLSYNEIGLLGYSFIAFIISGTPSKFMAALKSGTISIFQISNHHILNDLGELEKERDKLKSELTTGS